MIEYKDIRNAYDVYRQSIWLQYQENIRNVLGDKTERRNMLQREGQGWRTNINSPLQQEILDSFFAHLIDSTGIFTVEHSSIKEDVLKGEPESVEKLLNYVYSKNNTWNNMLSCAKDALQHGNGYGKVVWKKGEDEVEYFDGIKKKTIKLFEIDLPGIEYLSPFSLIIDPVAKNIQSARFICIRKFMNFGEIHKSFKKYFKGKTEEQIIQEYETKKVSVGTENIIEREDLSLSKQEIKLKMCMNHDYTNINLVPKDEAKETIEVMDRNGNIFIYIEGVLMYEGKSLYPFKGYPIFSVKYDHETDTFLSSGICDKTKGYQELMNIYLNSHADNQKLAGTSVFTRVITPGQNMFENSDTLDIKPMKIFNVEVPDGIKPLNLRINDNMIQEMDYIKSSAQISIGINELVMGSQGKVERSASGVNNLIQSFKARMRPLFLSMSESMVEIGKQWLQMIVSFTNAKENIQIKLKRDDGEYDIQTLSAEDLHGRWDIKFEISGLNTSMREIEKKQLQEILPIITGIRTQEGLSLVNEREIVQKVIELYGFSQKLLKTKEEMIPPQEQQGQGGLMDMLSGGQGQQQPTPPVDDDLDPITEMLGDMDSIETEPITEAGQMF